MYIKEKEICLASISKINSNCEKQIILFMIPIEEKEGWHYLPVKNLSTLLTGMTLKHHDDFFAWIAFIPLEQKIHLNLMKNYVKIKISVV